MGEGTIFRVMDLPEGTDYVWHDDVDVVALSDRLDQAGRIRVVEELHARWKVEHLRLVETA